MNQTAATPRVIDPALIARSVADAYDNRSLAAINDHEVRLSVMTHGFPWHHHPDSDETFLVIDGELVIEFESGEVVLGLGEMLTVPRGTMHRTRPCGARSVNLTFERQGAATTVAETERGPAS
jgi:mannose-6-phosphate isomerase-like protein (cupin superfamily)